jgi:hypothetical protein
MLGVLLSGNIYAQGGGYIKQCECKYITISVSKDVACKVNFVVIYPTLPSDLITVAPGQTIEVPCEDGAEITVVDCNFRKNPLGDDGCLRNFPAAAGCCIDACLTKDKNGCPLLEVTPSFLRCRCV